MTRRGLLLVALLALAAPARAGSFPQTKMDGLDLAEAPKVTLRFTFLGKTFKPISLKKIDEAQISRHDGRADRKGSVVRELVKGKSKDKKLDGELLEAGKAGQPLDAVLVVAGYGNPRFRESDLGPAIHDAVEIILKKFPKTGRLNLIWYNDLLWTRVMAAGRASELSRLNTNLRLCRDSRLEELSLTEEERAAKAEAEDGAPAGPACELFPNDGALGDIVKRQGRFEGHFPALFGLPPSLPEDPVHEHRALQGYKAESDDDGADRILVAMDVAVEMLLRASAPATPKALILISDGKDHYVEGLDMWRLRWKEDCRGKHSDDAGIAACVTTHETAHLTTQERLFADRVQRWLPLLRAADIRVFAIGLPTGTRYERERLEVLAHLSGGTYRDATHAESLAVQAAALAGELSGQLVVSFTDDALASGDEVGYSVKLRAGGYTFRSEPVFDHVPELPGGPAHLAKGLYQRLEQKVGSPWHIVILVVLGILALLILFLILKLGVKLGVKLVKKLFKGAGGAAKAAAKRGASGAGAASRWGR